MARSCTAGNTADLHRPYSLTILLPSAALPPQVDLDKVYRLPAPLRSRYHCNGPPPAHPAPTRTTPVRTYVRTQLNLAGVAQLAAHLSCKQVVRGSSPLVGSQFNPRPIGLQVAKYPRPSYISGVRVPATCPRCRAGRAMHPQNANPVNRGPGASASLTLYSALPPLCPVPVQGAAGTSPTHPPRSQRDPVTSAACGKAHAWRQLRKILIRGRRLSLQRSARRSGAHPPPPELTPPVSAPSSSHPGPGWRPTERWTWEEQQMPPAGPPSGKLQRAGCGFSVVAGQLGSSPRPSPGGLPDAGQPVKEKRLDGPTTARQNKSLPTEGKIRATPLSGLRPWRKRLGARLYTTT